MVLWVTLGIITAVEVVEEAAAAVEDLVLPVLLAAVPANPNTTMSKIPQEEPLLLAPRVLHPIKKCFGPS